VYGVTGAAHGIGRATADLLRRSGAGVIAIDRDAERLKALASEANDDRVLTVAADVTDAAAVEGAVAEAVRRFGRIDGWVNNAMFARRGAVDHQPPGEMDAAWQVNVMAAWNHCRLILPHLKRAGGGSIVNLSSIMVHAAGSGTAAYVSTKAAILGLTNALAVELAPHRVRVNAVAPGYILTYSETESSHPDPDVRAKATELRRKIDEINFRVHHPWPGHGRPEDVANTIVFLLSDAAAFITGTCVTVDGGFSVDLHAADQRLADAHAQTSELRRQLEALAVPTAPKR
jgi:NAD(P)-dependent dehydrogenase (short-subunit alcohol dehydrogenase family)